MIYIGIDFSINSPAVCVQHDNGDYEFISFFNFGDRNFESEKIPKAFHNHRELMNLGAIEAIPYNREISSADFIEREREKLIDGKSVARAIINRLVDYYGIINVKIALEGFSYGSTGNSFIDIVQYNTFLRSELLNMYGADKIYIMQPSHVKKLAGKGNANKHYMANAFQNNVLNDKSLEDSKFWNWTKNKDYSEKIPKPIDDIIDSYFILNCIKVLEHKNI
jgi:hypothetical protein